jgi:hypothetical protein
MILDKIVKAVILLIFLISSFSARSTENDTLFIYVSPNGSDHHPGTINAPVQTFEKSIKMVSCARIETPGSPVVVYFRGGKYRVKGTIVVPSSCSGTEKAPVIFKAYANEEPVFTGGIRLLQWEKVHDKGIRKIVPEDSFPHIYVADLKVNGITDFGDLLNEFQRPDLYFNHVVQTIARWPNSGFTKSGRAVGKTVIPPAWNGASGTAEGIFNYTDKRIDKWANEKDPRLFGYWFWDWDNGYSKIEKFDVNSRTIYLPEPYRGSGYKHGFSFYGANLLCELDTIGEYYIDRELGKLYWYAPVSVNPNSEESELIYSDLTSEFMLSVNDCEYVSVNGLTFYETRGNCMAIKNGRNCTIENCRLERISGNGINVINGRNHTIKGNLLQQLGRGGIDCRGGERKTLTPANHRVEGNIINNFSIFQRTYCGAINLAGCGMIATHNQVTCAPSSAIGVDGNDLIYEYNWIENVVQESDDQGAVDTYFDLSSRGIVFRYNRWAKIQGGTHCGTAAIRLDDMVSGFKIYGNIFDQCGYRMFGAVQIHAGNENVIEDNLFYQCPHALSLTPSEEGEWMKNYNSGDMKRAIFKKVDVTSPLFQEKYPELKRLGEDIDLNVFRNNLLVDTPLKVLSTAGIKLLDSNNPQVDSDGKSLGYFCSPAILHSFNIQRIPVNEMGCFHNRWADKCSYKISHL